MRRRVLKASAAGAIGTSFFGVVSAEDSEGTIAYTDLSKRGQRLFTAALRRNGAIYSAIQMTDNLILHTAVKYDGDMYNLNTSHWSESHHKISPVVEEESITEEWGIVNFDELSNRSKAIFLQAVENDGKKVSGKLGEVFPLTFAENRFVVYNGKTYDTNYRNEDLTQFELNPELNSTS